MASKARLRKILADIRQLVREEKFEFTGHCLRKSLPDDDFTATDALTAILNGWIEREEWDDNLGLEKYVVYGYALGGRGIGLVTRFAVNESGMLVLIITAYEIFFEIDDE